MLILPIGLLLDMPKLDLCWQSERGLLYFCHTDILTRMPQEWSGNVIKQDYIWERMPARDDYCSAQNKQTQQEEWVLNVINPNHQISQTSLM